MGTEIIAIVGHKLDEKEIAELPNALNAYFQKHAKAIRFRRFAFSGEIVKRENEFVWDSSFYPEEIQNETEPEIDKQSPWAWKSNFEISGMRTLSGPFNLDFQLGGSAGLLRSDVHWEYLIYDEIFQSDFRRTVRLLCSFFTSSFAIYVPDDIEPWCYADEKVSEGKNLDEIRDWLRETGSPAKNFRELFSSKSEQAAGYFVDDFENLT